MAVEHCWEGIDLSKRWRKAYCNPCSLGKERKWSFTFIITAGDTFLIEPAMVGYNIRIGLVARICRSQSSKDDQFRQGRGSIPRFGRYSFDLFCYLQRSPSRLSAVLQRSMTASIIYSIGYCVLCGLVVDRRRAVVWTTDSKAQTVEVEVRGRCVGLVPKDKTYSRAVGARTWQSSSR